MNDKTTTVVHCKKAPFDIYIGRPSVWGNPFKIGRDGTRSGVIEKFETYARHNPIIQARLHELQGKTLGCWCKPLTCHGDVYIKLLNERR